MLLKKIIVISFGIMVYCGLRGYDLAADLMILIFILSVFAFESGKSK